MTSEYTKGCTGSEIALELGRAALHKFYYFWNICYEKCNVYSTLLEKILIWIQLKWVTLEQNPTGTQKS